jgi:hypothetical protein
VIGGETLYPSGQWRGYWEQSYWGRQVMTELVLHFVGGQVQGRGRDVIGAFTFTGQYDDRGTITMVKQYLGRHSVAYRGQYDGEGTIFGQWSIGSEWSGPFALTPNRAVTPPELPITEL